jgi:hypothetical protein
MLSRLLRLQRREGVEGSPLVQVDQGQRPLLRIAEGHLRAQQLRPEARFHQRGVDCMQVGDRGGQVQRIRYGTTSQVKP